MLFVGGLPAGAAEIDAAPLLGSYVVGTPRVSIGITGGIGVTERWSRGSFGLTLWQDVQTPITLYVFDGTLPRYIPFDVGFSIGAEREGTQPHLGAFVSMLSLLDAGDQPSLEERIWMAGAQLGIDAPLGPSLQLGIDLRFSTAFNSINYQTYDRRMWESQLVLTLKFGLLHQSDEGAVNGGDQ